MGAATMLRKILAIVLGMVIGSVVNMMFVQLSNSVYPLPEGVDPNDFEAFKAYVEAHGLPTGVLLIVLIAHAGGSFASGFVCGAIVKKPWYFAAALLGILWTAGGVAMLLMLPSPIWFAITDVAFYIPAALFGTWAGGRLIGGATPASPAD